MTKTLVSTLILTGLSAGCASKADTEEAVISDGMARFAEATDDEIHSAILAARGEDLGLAEAMAVNVDAMVLGDCVTGTHGADRITYLALQDNRCGVSGAMTVFGITATGWALREQPADLTVNFDDLSLDLIDEHAQAMTIRLDGTFLTETDDDNRPIHVEAHLRQSLGSGLIISEMSKSLDPSNPTQMIHDPDSSAFVDGLGWFDISGTATTAELGAQTVNLVLSGADTLVFDGARDADDCLTFTIDGQNDRICGL
jgi:hypothetical protein